MKYIQPMNRDAFAQYLLTLKTGDVIEFGIDCNTDWPNEMPTPKEIENWYFAKVMKIPEYESRFILIDYCGGEEAFAIPLNCYCDHCDEDDKKIVSDYVNYFFANHCDTYNPEHGFVFVEMEETL